MTRSIQAVIASRKPIKAFASLSPFLEDQVAVDQISVQLPAKPFEASAGVNQIELNHLIGFHEEQYCHCLCRKIDSHEVGRAP